jgi:hypothetical protein
MLEAPWSCQRLSVAPAVIRCFENREVSRQNFNPAARAKIAQGESIQRGVPITVLLL